MIHSFCFDYHGKEFFLCFDSFSLSLFSLDYDSYLVVKNKYESLNSSELKAFSSLPKQLVDEIEQEWDAEFKANKLNEEYALPFKKSRIIKALCLNICHDCNLACKYCFAKEGTYNTQRDYMSFEVGKKAIDFLIKSSGSIKNIEADFFGGEPLMNFDVVKQIVEYANNEVKKFGKNISFTLTTNALLLDDEAIKYLNENMQNVVISIDGRQCIHDNVRCTRSGNSAYKAILKHAQAFRAVRGNKNYYIRGTFTSQNLDFTEDFKAIHDAGFDQISLEPVVLDDGHFLAISPLDLPKILSEYDKLTTLYLDRRKEGNYCNFFHFMLDLDQAPCIEKRLSGCGAGCNYVAVSPTGDIYPCHQFVGQEQYRLGNVLDDTFDKEAQSFYTGVTVNNKEGCQHCFAKYYCGGGCMANAKFFAGDFFKSYSLSCEMMKKRLECSLAIYAIEKTLNNQ